VLGGIAGPVYSEVETFLFPDAAFGDYVALTASDEAGGAPLHEYLKLRSHDGSVWGDSRAGAKKWRYSGFLTNGYLVLAYRSEGPKSIGFGDYLLEAKTADGSDYVGQMQGNFCPDRAIKRCDAILVRGEPGGPEEAAALAKYQNLLSRQCTVAAPAQNIAAADCGH